MGERQRERGRQNLKQAPGSELSAQSPMQGSNAMNCEPKSDAQLTELPSHPQGALLKWGKHSIELPTVLFS